MAEPRDPDAGLTRRLRAFLETSSPKPGGPFPCSYLSGRTARHVTLLPTRVVPGLYQSFMNLNFRRSGHTFYRPACDACSECRMIRLPVEAFAPKRSQRRCLATNRDVTVVVQPKTPTEEKRRLFARYLEARHDGSMDASPETFESFLYESPVAGLEIEYRAEGKLLGVGLFDLEPESLSAVYFFFDPEAEPRSPGVLNVLTLVAEARRLGKPWLYLGYWVKGSRTMDYKLGYRPCEVLQADGGWLRFD